MRPRPKTLADSICILLEFMERGGEHAPVGEFLVFEGLLYRDETLPAASVLTVEEFNPRFDELMGRGLSWINVSGVGVYRGAFLVSVFPQHRPPARRCEFTSVNVSYTRSWHLNSVREA